MQCDTFTTEQYKAIPFLDVSATYSKEAGVVFINVVNRHKDNAITAAIQSTSGNFDGKAEASIVTVDDLQKTFEYAKRDQYVPVKKPVETGKDQLRFSFPPHSYTQIKVSVGSKR